MKKFHFPLERVREWREKQVSVEEARLEALCAERAGIARLVDEIETERAANESAVIGGQSVDPLLLRALDEFRRFARYRELQLARELAGCESRIAEQRLRVVDAQRKTRLLEKLKDRKRRVWSAEVEKELEQEAAEAHLAKWIAQ